MCSIFGIIGEQNNLKRTAVLKKMAEDQLHRGPDDGGFFEDEFCAFGHRRLSIIDLSTNARQPMQSNNGRNILVLNGEIYNYPVLRKELEACGHTFSSSSDTECIIHLYEEYGNDMTSRLDGFFAFALSGLATVCAAALHRRSGALCVYRYCNSSLRSIARLIVLIYSVCPMISK